MLSDPKRMRLPLSWHWIQWVRDVVQSTLDDYENEVVEACVMAASELAENVVKHGEPLSGEECGYVTVHLEEGKFTIQTTNHLKSERSRYDLRRRVDEIRASNDVQQLFVERLQALVVGTQADSQLGLLRIAFEGGFDLAFNSYDTLVTITATRTVSKGK